MIFRKANHADLKEIVRLLIEDTLGATRERQTDFSAYEKAFLDIDSDKNQILMVSCED